VLHKACHIDRYDGSSNTEEFVQVYQTVIEDAGEDNRVKVNFVPTCDIPATPGLAIVTSDSYLGS
jgi:hypothetical protein